MVLVAQKPLEFLNKSDKNWERSGSVVECLTRDGGLEPHRRHCVINPSLILVDLPGRPVPL